VAETTIQRSFAAGELAPALHARADVEKYLSGLKTCRNFLVRREGGVSNRAGFRFVSGCKDNVAGKRLFPYVSSVAGQGLAIEVGIGYMRFYQNGALINVSAVAAYSGVTNYVPGDLVVELGVNYYCIAATVGNAPPNGAFWYALTGTIYEIPTPYAAAPTGWVQSGNVITITTPATAPRELVFSSLTRWVLRAVTTVPSITAPGGTGGVAGTVGTRNYAYVVTAAKTDTYEESLASTPIAVLLCTEPTTAAPNVITWAAVTGAAEYYVYCDPYENGTFGFVGTATGLLAFNDIGFVPDFNVTPPIGRALFATTDDFPSTAAYFQQRRWFANTNDEPDVIWGSRVGFHSNFGIASPLQDDDAVTFSIAGNNHNPVRHMVATKSGLIPMTDAGEWTVTGGGGPKSPITPSSIDAEQETYVGISATVPPVIIGNAILYAQARGSIVRELKFNQEVEGLGGRDLTIYASHLFEGKASTAIAFQQVPDSLVWMALDDGSLVALTYIPEQEVWGWHRHDSQGGLFESLTVVPEAKEDALYAIVARTIGGNTVRYVERLATRVIRPAFPNTDSFFVDSGLTYNGAPATVMSGLTHLDGQLVAVIADGVRIFDGIAATATPAQITQFTVAAGSITLSAAASIVHIGLAITAQIQTLDMDVQGTNVRDKKKRVASVALLIERSSRVFQAGPTTSDLRTYDQQSYEPTSTQHTGIVSMTLSSSFEETGSVIVQQTNGLPITILGILPNVDLGG